jgi:uncharacterized membrane protein YkgB
MFFHKCQRPSLTIEHSYSFVYFNLYDFRQDLFNQGHKNKLPREPARNWVLKNSEYEIKRTAGIISIIYTLLTRVQTAVQQKFLICPRDAFISSKPTQVTGKVSRTKICTWRM